MEFRNSKKKRRWGVILTYLLLMGILFIFEYCKNHQWTNLSVMIEITLIIGLMVSFIIIYLRTGLWSFIHKPIRELDEREIALTSKSLRYAYGIFAVIILSILLALALLATTIDVVIVASLILFAHLLPASVIAWTEKQV